MRISARMLCLVALWPMQLYGSGHAMGESTGGAGSQFSGCGYPRVRVVAASSGELRRACDALAEVVRYFGKLGIDVHPRFSLVYRDRESDLLFPDRQAFSYFDLDALEIVIHPSVGERSWGLPPGSEVADSFIRHEMVHMALAAILADDYRKIRREWHEFIAYAIQFDLMSASLRNTILANYPTAESFENLLHVNEFTFSNAEPDRFSIMAYRTYVAHGGPAFVGKLLRFEIVPPAPARIFPPNFFDLPQAQ